MKKLFLVFCGVFLAGSGVSAGEIRNVITDSVQLTINGSATSTNRLASSYSVSGSNIDVTTMGGLTGGTAGTAATLSAGEYDIATSGQAFTLSESALIGSSTTATQAIDGTTNLFATHNTYGNLTTTTGGTKGTLAGTLSPTGIATVTAGGQGTTALGQRTVSLSVFE